MKKILIIAILALSLNVYAQNLRPSVANHHLQYYSIRSGHDKLSEGKSKTLGSFPENNFPNSFQHHSRDLFPPVQVIDSIYAWQLDTSNSGWIYDYKIIDIVYGTHNLPSSYIQQYWTGISWLNDTKYNLTFDANDNQTYELEQTWDGVNWVDTYQTLYTFNANNNLIIELDQSWNDTVWENDNQFIPTYDANNNLVSELNQSWNDTVWEDFLNVIYTYDVNNDQVGEIDQYWDGSAWVTITQAIYTYDDNHNRTGGLVQLLLGSTFEDYAQYSYTYDANNNQIASKTQSWDGNEWINFSIGRFHYDNDNFLTSEVEEYFDSLGISIIYGDSIHYYFHSVTGTKDLSKNDENISVYPNPSNGLVTVHFPDSFSSIEVYNILGERIDADFKFSTHTSKDIDLSNQGKGIYFIHVFDGMKTYIRKVIIQ